MSVLADQAPLVIQNQIANIAQHLRDTLAAQLTAALIPDAETQALIDSAAQTYAAASVMSIGAGAEQLAELKFQRDAALATLDAITVKQQLNLGGLFRQVAPTVVAALIDVALKAIILLV